MSRAGPSTLPPTHFLSLPPTHFSTVHPAHPPTLSHLSRGVAPNTASLASADFDVDVRTGFLPPLPPVARLPSEFEVWEAALEAARGGKGAGVGDGLRLGGGPREEAWRAGVDQMPVLQTDSLRSSLPNLRRAHLVLSFLLHFYVHTHPTPSSPRTTPLPIPPSISVPILRISPLLGLPPILTYADTVLYNSHPADSTCSPALVSNPLTTSLETFTNTPDEAHFYLTSARCELAGVQALTLMRKSMDEAFVGDALALTRLTRYLNALAPQIELVGDAIMSVRENCRPEVFYHLIRPWFKGGDADGPGSLGWAFLGVDEREGEELVDRRGEHVEQDTTRREGQVKGRTFSGPSAGQSTLIHALDVFLMVDHTPKVEGTADSTTTTREQSFMTRMLAYMPLPHRTFLGHLSTTPHPIRALVLKHATTRPDLVQAYDRAVQALKKLRDHHMRIVTAYIIQQARREPSEEIIAMGAPRPAVDEPAHLADFRSEVEREKAVDEELRGTGGTALIKFLKMCRDNTTKTMIGHSV